MLVAPGPMEVVHGHRRGGGAWSWRRRWRRAPSPARCGRGRSAARPHAVQRLADAGDVAVAEDRPHAFDVALAVLVRLHRKPAHHRLRGGEVDRSHFTFSRALSQTPHSRANRCAIAATASASGVSPFNQARATSPKIVRPTAKPFTKGNFAASANEAASSASGASRPSTTTPRVRGSLRSIAATALRHAVAVLNGSSFHQSG